MRSIKEILMTRDNMNGNDADELISECKQDLIDRIGSGDSSSFDICGEYFGLEPDYLFELVPLF